MATKVTVAYDHDPADLADVELAITTGNHPNTSSWRPAYRDTVDGQRVVWARFDSHTGRKVTVWIRDRNGIRPVISTTV